MVEGSPRCSDNYMNPANSPDSFDRESIQMMRESGARQTWQVVGTQVRFARALVADMSCMRCHSSPESAPTSVSSKYRGLPGGAKGGGYGYKVGDVVGITSVTVPHATPLAMLASQSVWFWVSAAVVLGLMVLSYWLALVGVVAEYTRIVPEWVMLILFLLAFFLYGYCIKRAWKVARLVKRIRRRIRRHSGNKPKLTK